MDVHPTSTGQEPHRRASKPKVRTGCARCKQRHVKCDEARPACSACTRSSTNCEYIILDRKKHVRRNKTRTTVHPPHEPRALAVLRPARPKDVDAAGVSRGLRFGPRTTATEATYFGCFEIIVSGELAHPDLWRRAMLRESMRDDCIRYGVMAIGALSRAIHGTPNSESPCLSLTAPGFLANPDYQAAISYYSTALGLLRRNLATSGIERSSRSVLMATFMFIGFENMLDNTKSVDMLMANSIHLLRNQLACFHRDGRRIATVVDDAGMAIAEYLLPRLALMSSSALPLFPTTRQVPLPAYPTPPPLKLPHRFQSIRDLRNAWDQSSTYYALWLFRCIQTMAEGIPLDPKCFTKQQNVIVSQLDRWERTVKKILAIETNIAKKRALMLCLLAVHGIHSMILCFADQTLMAWDAQSARLGEAVGYVEAAMAIPRSKSGRDDEHIFDDSIVPVVDSISLLCRDESVRKRTKTLRETLAKASRTWGPMPKEKTARLGVQVVVAVEEQGRNKDGFIPMEARYSWTGATWNADRTELLITLTGTTHHLNGTRVEKTVAYRPRTKTIVMRSGWEQPSMVMSLETECAIDSGTDS